MTDGSYTPGGLGVAYIPSAVAGSDNSSQSCSGGPVFLPPCQSTLSGTADYLMNISSIDAMSDDNVPIRVEALNHHNAFIDSTNACDGDYKYGNADSVQWMDAGTVPVATLEGTAPFTVTASNTFNDQEGHTFTRTMTVTLQPTDENGNPLQ